MPWKEIGLVALLSLGMLTVSFLALLVFIAKIPEDFFVRPRKPSSLPPLLRGAWTVARNVLGWLLIVVGFLLSVPGVPGQGLLIVFIGVLLAEFPGKNRLRRWLLHRPQVTRVLNFLRRKLKKPPLEFPK